MALAVMVAWLAWSAVPALASTYTVMNTDPSGTGSLTAAVTIANYDPGSTIVFAPGVSGFIDLLSPLAITQNVTIDGPGASTLELDGHGGSIEIMTVSSPATVAISGLRFAFGAATTDGGAIANSGTLTISNSTFDHNAAGGPGSSSLSRGVAIYNAGALTVSGSTFANNTAGGTGGSAFGSGTGEGGAIFSDNSSSLRVGGSTFAANSVGGDGGSRDVSGEGVGGAIAVNGSSSLTLFDSTLTENKAGGAGGGGGLSGVGDGAGVSVGSNVTATLQQDTIDANAVGSAFGSSGAGVFNQGTLPVVGTIVLGNTGGTNCSSQGTLSARASLEGPAGQTSCGFDLPSADPLLLAPADNGGPTQTQALGAGSPAIGAVASASDCAGGDQRGAQRPLGSCDVGAYEVAPPIIIGTNAPRIGTTSAQVVASVFNPDVWPGTVIFQYGTTTAYGSSTAAQVLPAHTPSGPYTTTLSGLKPGTIYHFRVVAANPDGPVVGPDQEFTTASFPVSPTPGPSNFFTFGKAKVGPRGAITLPVNPRDAGRFTAKATFTVITRRGHKRVKTTFTYGTASVRSTGPTTFKLVIGLKRRAARELKLLGSRQVTIAVTFTPTGAAASHKTKKVTVKRSRKGKYS